MDCAQDSGFSLRGLESVASAAGLGRVRPEQARSPQEAGRQFEQLLAGMLVREMRRTLPSGFFGEQPGADTYDGWLDEQVGRAIAESGSLRIAGLVERGLERAQAAARRAQEQQEP